MAIVANAAGVVPGFGISEVDESLVVSEGHPGQRTGAYYTQRSSLIGTSTTAMTAGRLVYAPAFLPNFLIDEVAIEVTTALAGMCRIGAYTNHDGLPHELIFESPEISTGAIGVITQAISEVRLPDGFFWLAANFSVAPTMRTGNADNTSLLGSNSLSSAPRGIFVSHAYGNLPAIAPTPTGQTGDMPIVGLRKV